MRPDVFGCECTGNADVHLTYPAVAGVTGEPPADQLIQRKTMSTINTISRDGLPPIRYTGEILGTKSSRDHNSTRWYVYTIHRTASGKLILETVYVSQWEGERCLRSATVFPDVESLCKTERDEVVPEVLSDLLEELFPDQWIEIVD